MSIISLSFESESNLLKIIYIFLVNICLLIVVLKIKPSSLFNFFKKFKSELSKGQALYLQISSLHPMTADFSNEGNEIGQVEYKFFSEIFLSLFEMNRKFGAKISEPWQVLRRSLQKDLAFEKKLVSLSSQALAQMAVMSSFLIVFALSFSIILETSLPLHVWGVIFILIIMSWVSYLVFFYQIKRNQWRFAGPILNTLAYISSLNGIGLSSTEVLKKSNAVCLDKINDEKFSVLLKQFRSVTYAWQNKGTPIRDHITELQTEFWYVMEQKLETMTKKVQILQMGCTFLFILPAFFFLVLNTFLSFSGFLIE